MTHYVNMSKLDPVILKFESWRNGTDAVDGHLSPILIKYTASWCGPCKVLTFEKVMEGLAGMGLTFVEIDVDNHPQAVDYFGVRSIPAFVLLVPSGDKRKHVGPTVFSSVAPLKNWVSSHTLESNFS